MAAPERGSFRIIQGEDLAQPFASADGSTFTGQTIVLAFKSSAGETGQTSCTVTSSTTFSAIFASATTVDLTPGTYTFEARRVDTGSYTVLCRGEMVVVAKVKDWPVDP